MLPYKRADRVKKVIQQDLCALLASEIKDPGIGFITITEVELSDDMRESKVYYSVLGDEKQRADTRAALERAKPFIKRRLGDMLDLRKVPNIQFRFDATYERAEKVFALMEKISRENKKEEPE